MSSALQFSPPIPPTSTLAAPNLLPPLPTPKDNAAMSQAPIERERLAHDVKLLSEQLAALDEEYKRKREELIRLFGKFEGRPPQPSPRQPRHDE